MDVNWIVDPPFEALPGGDPDTVAISLDATEPLTYRQLRHRRDEFVQVLCVAEVQPGVRAEMSGLGARGAHRLRADVDVLPRPSGSDPLMLMYTSGTTGRPKGVVWTHGGSLWLADAHAVKWSYTAGTVAMITGPLYHAGAVDTLLLPALLVHGKAVVMSSDGMYTVRIVETIVRASTTHVLQYPFLGYELVRNVSVTRERLGSLEGILTGGDPVLSWALLAIDEKFPGMELQQGYGLTEATMAVCLDHEHRLGHPDGIGGPKPMVAVRVDGPDGRFVGPDEVGEIRIHAPWVTHRILESARGDGGDACGRLGVHRGPRSGRPGRVPRCRRTGQGHDPQRRGEHLPGGGRGGPGPSPGRRGSGGRRRPGCEVPRGRRRGGGARRAPPSSKSSEGWSGSGWPVTSGRDSTSSPTGYR